MSSYSVHIIGDGSAEGAEEALLVKASDTILLIFPWGMDYGCGIRAIYVLSHEEYDNLVKEFPYNEYADVDALWKRFEKRPNII